MRIAFIGDEEYPVFARVAEHLEADFVPIAELGLSTVNGKSGVDRTDGRLSGYDAVFIQAKPRLMLFVEPLLDELAENGVACQIKPTAFNILANKPYTAVSLASRNVPIPLMRSVPGGSGVETAVDGLAFPILIEAYRDLDRAQAMILNDKQSLYPFLRSIPFEYNLIMLQELHTGVLTDSIVVDEDVYSVRRAWNAERLEHSGRPLSTKMSSDDKQTAIAATRALGVDIARVKMIDGKIIEVDPRVPIERYEKVLGVDIARRIARYFEEKIA